MAKKLKKATPELLQDLYALIGAKAPVEPIETLTITFTEEGCIRIIETRYVTEEIVPFVPTAPD